MTSSLSADCTRLVFEAVNQKSACKLRLAENSFDEYFLLTSLAQCNEEGETPLVIAMKGKNVSVINEILSWISANEVSYGRFRDQPLCELIIDKLSPYIPVVIEIIDFFHNKPFLLRFIGQVIIESTSFTRQGKIITLEYIGAAIVFHAVRDLYDYFWFVESGLEFWREAMTLRHFPQDGGPSIPKAVCVQSEASSVVFGSKPTVEVMTMEDLDMLKEEYSHFEYFFQSNTFFDDHYNHYNVKYLIAKRFKVQAFLVIRRIPILANFRHPHWLYLKNLMDYAINWQFLQTKPAPPFEKSAEDRKIKINIYLLILEQLNGFDPNLLSRQTFDVLFETLHHLGKDLNRMLIDDYDEGLREEITFTYLLAASKFINTIQGCDLLIRFYAHLHLEKLVCHFLWVLYAISPRLTKQEKQKLENYFYVYIKNSPERKSTVLHAAIIISITRFDNYTEHLYGIPFYSLERQSETSECLFIDFILELGADPNAIDNYGETPLHILAKWEKLSYRGCSKVFQTLVDAGTYLDTAADDGKTVLSILKKAIHEAEQPYYSTSPSQRDIPYMKSLIIPFVLSLSCYAARVIRRNAIRYDRLPPRLQQLVSCRRTKDFDAE